MSAIFYHDETQQKLAEKTKIEHQKHIARPIVTVMQKAGPFYNAEE
jgi:peptide methionine sulfoxide reductase MsrA